MRKSRTLKLFIDAHVFDGPYQGSRTFIEGIYNYLAKKKDLELFIAAHDVGNLKKYFPSSENVHFIRYKTRSRFIRLLLEIPSLIRKNKIDWAHFQYIAPIMKNCKFIVSIHDMIFRDLPGEYSLSYRFSKTMLYKISALRADILTTVSAYSEVTIKKHLSIKEKIIHIIPNGISKIFFRNYDKAKAAEFIKQKYGCINYILYVSRIEPRKNHVFLLKAYIELELYKKGIMLVLLGHHAMDVPQFDRLLAKQTEEIRKNIFMKADVANEALLQFYRAAVVVVYPSKAEGFGIPPLEAAALKVPVICSNSSAMSEFEFFDENHVDPLNYNEFRERLKITTQSRVDDEKLSEISNIIREKYSWTHSSEKLYHVILDQEHKSP